MHHHEQNNGKSAMANASQQAPNALTPMRIVMIAATYIDTAANEARRWLQEAGHRVMIVDAGMNDESAQKQVAEFAPDAWLVLALNDYANRLYQARQGVGARLFETALQSGLPVAVAPGGLDGVHFGAEEATPRQFGRRLLHILSPQETIMRTDVSENARLGRLLAETINEATGPVAVCLPLRGLSDLDAPGAPLYNSETNIALFGNLTTHLDRGVRLHDMNANINDPAFAQLCVETLFALCALEAR